ncbi:MAG: beta-glucosidase, partial [Ilumatobacter sp.]
VRFFGSTPEGVDPRGFATRITGSFVPDSDGPHVIGVVSTGPFIMDIDGATIINDVQMELPRSQEFFGYGSVEATATVECTAGVPIELNLRWATSEMNGFAALRVGFRSPEPGDLMERAVAAAAAADVAVVMVGTNDEWETEGFDRTTMDLPGRQNELVRRVVAANPRTAVIVNAGSPVTMDWADAADASSARAVLTSFFAGQEQAESLVDVLLGVADPGGRLPTTIPVRLADHPAYLHHLPDHDGAGNGTQAYGEGLFIGYRGYDARDIAPRFAFGHGLSYGSASWGNAVITSESADGITVEVPVAATGSRVATVVVQGYIAAIDAPCIRPPKELKTWDKFVVEPGTSHAAQLEFPRSAFRRWDTATGSWIVDAGDYEVVIAASATDIRQRLRVTLA